MQRKYMLSMLVSTCAFFIMLVMSFMTFFGIFTQKAEAVSSYTRVNIGEIWGSEAKKFNKTNLGLLYIAITGKTDATIDDVKNATNGTQILFQDIIPSSVVAQSSEYRINNYKNSADFAKDIRVTINGQPWVVTWVSRSGNASQNGGDVVVTLLYDGSVRANTHWAGHAVDSNVYGGSLVNYPGGIYTYSYIRNAINGYDVYSSTDNSFNTRFTDAEKHKFSIFEKYRSEEFTQYLVQPKDVLVQSFMTQLTTEVTNYNNMQAVFDDSWWTAYNEFYGTKGAYYNVDANVRYETLSTYGDWKNDYLWIPSQGEIGGWVDQSPYTLWEMSNSTRLYGTGYWTRMYDSYGGGILGIGDDGNGFFAHGEDAVTWGEDDLAARPAMHLNLTAVDEASVEVSEIPINMELEYAAANLGVTEDNAPWLKSGITVTYQTADGATVAGCKDVGTYTATATVSDKDAVMWTDGTNAPKTFTLRVKKRKIKVNFSMPEGEALPIATIDESNIPRSEENPPTLWITYRGTGNISFSGDEANPPTSPGTYRAEATLKTGGENYEIDTTGNTHLYNFEYQQIAIPKPVLLDTESVTYDGMPTEFAFENFEANKFLFTLPEGVTVGKEGVIATDAGTYTIGIAPKEQYVWSEGGYAKQEYTITIDRAPLRVGITSVTGGTIGGEAGSATDAGAQVTVFANVPAGDRVKINITATPVNGGRTYVVYTGAELIGAEGADVQLDLSKITAVGEYRLNVTAEAGEGDNKNYDITIAENVTLTVRAPENRVNLIWFLAHNGKTETIAAGQSQNYDYEGRLYYDGGKEYRFSVNTGALAASGFAVDTDYNEGAYVNGYSVAAASVAGSYTTSVKLKTTGGADAGIYSVNWTIEKALYDFTNVKWMNNGRLYYTGAPQSMMLDPATVPGGLLVNYNSGTATEVTPEGEYYTATIISFEIEDKDNYILPLVGDDTTYIYNGSEPFEWSKQWRIDKTLIAERWSVEHRVDGNGRKYDIYVISNEDHRAYVDHLYFETNRQGVKLSETPISPEDIEVTPKTVKYYICEVTLKANAENGFEITGGKYTSLPFEVGHNQTEVRFEADESMRYTGEARELELRLVEGTLSAKAYEIVYYERNGTTALDGAPVNVGEYRAEVTLKAEYAENYYIEGDTVFEFAITPALIAVNWNRETTPPRLTLPSSQAKYVEYLFYDMLGNSLTFADLTQGEYRIRARIKAEYAENYDFAELNADITEYEEFSVTSSDKLNDPNDPMGGTDPRPPVDMQIVLPVNWNNGMKPPRLTLDALQASLVEYVFYNAEGAEIGFEQISVGTYGVKAKIKATYAAQYDFFGGTDETETVSFTVVSGEQIRNPNEPIDPNDPNGNGGTTGDKPTDSFLPENLPLWQLITGGISAVLIVVFLAKIFSLGARTKKAKAATAYSFGGIGALLAMDGAWLGLPQIGWTAIAVGLMGLAAALFVVFILMNRKCLAAEAEAIAAEKRRQEEKEEERRRRDDEFKIMMANMMNRPMPESSPMFDVQALLTGMQESMGNMITALLPATAGANAGENETVKLLLAQNSEMMEKLNNQPAVDGSASDERMRALEERMAEQQRLAEERAAEQQRIADERLAQQQAMMLEQQRMAEERAAEQQRIAEERAAEQQRLAEERLQAERADAQRREEDARKMQQEMMARQEELIKKMLEREAAPVVVQQEGGGGSNTTNSFVYEVEEEKLSIDRLTLAEAYEAMNANAKKLFDDLVAYVTSKPETVESDGKYAISFKYRAKALFKLVIKRGIPTMNYSTEGEQLRQIKRDAAASEGLKVRFKLSELQVMDSSTFDVAKEVIKVCMEQIDKDIEFLKEQKAAKRRKPKE